MFVEAGSTTTASICDPINVDPNNNLVRWYKVKTDIKADERGSGGITAVFDEDMLDGDFITNWKDQTRNANAVQTTGEDKPHWKLVENAVHFDNSADMTFTAIEIAEEANFSVIFRIKPIAFQSGGDVLIGSDSNNFLRWSSSANFRAKIGGAGNNNFNDGSNTLSTSVYSTVIFVRSNGSEGDLNIYVKPSNSDTEVDWASGHGNQDKDGLTLSMIGAESDDTNSLNAYVKDILIYNGTALDADQRACIYDYLEQQPY